MNDLKYALRSLLRASGFSLVAIVTLALGIGANTAIFSVVNAVLLRPLPYPDPEQLVAVWESYPAKGVFRQAVAPPSFRDWQEQNRAFEYIAATAGQNFILTGADEPIRVAGLSVSAGFFSLIGVQPAIGRVIAQHEDRPDGDHVVVMTQGLWQRRYGADPSLVGQNILVSGVQHRVIGVLPPSFTYAGDPELFVPLALPPEELSESQRSSHYLDVVGRLKRSTTLEQARMEMNGLARRFELQYPKTNTGRGITMLPMLEARVGQFRSTLVLLLGAVTFVLLIASANVANLLLARGAARQKEIGIRFALGAGRMRIVRQLLMESILLSLIGGVLGAVLSMWGVDMIVALSPANVPRLNEIGIDANVLGFTFVISLLTGIVFGLVPALLSSRPSAESISRDSRRQRLRSWLVAIEIALSLVLLIGAGLMIRSFARLISVQPGFDSTKVVTMEIALPAAKYRDGQQRSAFFRRLIAQIGATPGVQAVGATTNLPLSRTNMAFMFYLQGRPGVDKALPANFRAVSPEYFEVLGVPLRRGRAFTEFDLEHNAAPVVMINATMARRYFPNQDPVGQRIAITRGRQQIWREIVGVVGDVHHSGLDTEPSPEMYIPFSQDMFPFLRVVVRTEQPLALIASGLRSAVWSLDKDQPITNIRPLEDFVATSVAQPRFDALLLGLFASAALILASVGIYGVISYTVVRQTREIGIRMALGARQRGVIWRVVGIGMLPAVIGVGIGLVASISLTSLVEKLLYGITPTDPATYAGVSTFLVIVALVAAYIPARRAARIDPMIALRCE